MRKKKLSCVCKGNQKSQHTRSKTWEEYSYLVLEFVGVTKRDYTRRDYTRRDYTRRDYIRRDYTRRDTLMYARTALLTL